MKRFILNFTKLQRNYLRKWLAVTFLLLSTCQKNFNSPNFFQIRGGINVVSARLWKDNSLLGRSVRVELGFWAPPKRPLSSFHRPYLGKTWRQPLCEWEQISALSLHSPRSRKIQYLAYLRDQNLALWGRWHGRGTQRAQGRGVAACWPIDTPAPGCEMGYHARSGWWTEKTDQEINN